MLDTKKALQVDSKERADEELKPISSTTSIPKFTVLFNQTPYKNKEIAIDNIADIHKEFKSNTNEQLTLKQILERVTDGYAVRFGNFTFQPYSNDQIEKLRILRDNPHEYSEKKNEFDGKRQLRLKNSNIIALDVDDDTGRTNPIDVFNSIGANALYYSYSHNTWSDFNGYQNAYRLIFICDETIADRSLYEHIRNEYINKIYGRFPELRPHETENGKLKGGIDKVSIDSFLFGTSNKDYKINEEAPKVNVQSFVYAYNKKRLFESMVARKTNKNFAGLRSVVNDSKIIHVANQIGDTNGYLDHKEWETVAIGLWNSAQLGEIEEETALEALQILDGYNRSETYYQKFKRPLDQLPEDKQATIGSFNRLASQKGINYRVYTYQTTKQNEQTQTPINTNTINIERYISKDDMLTIIKDSVKKALVTAPTNSGKTYATIEAGKEYLNQNKETFIYFATPSIALSRQIAEKYSLGEALEGKKNVDNIIKGAIYDGSRLITGTYDKARLILRKLPKDMKLTVIVDEAHQEVNAYNYRRKAINDLFNLADNGRVNKFIGLTGTPEEINLENYQQLNRIYQSNQQPLAERLVFPLYQKASLFTEVTTRSIIKEVKAGKKVLAFINNKKQIERIRKALRKVDIAVQTVTSDSRNSQTYTYLAKYEAFPKDTQVILATSVIADGININNDENYSCVIAPHYQEAPFFNTATLRQATNRFRQTYNKIIVPLFIKSDLEEFREQNTKAFDFEPNYRELLEDSEKTSHILYDFFKDTPDLFKGSIIEHASSLFNPTKEKRFNYWEAYNERKKRDSGRSDYNKRIVEDLEELTEQKLVIDKRAVRLQISKDKADYYSYFPFAFIKKVQSMLNMEGEQVDAYSYFANEDESDRQTIQETINYLKAMANKENQEKADRLTETLTEDLYSDLQNEYYSNNDQWREDSELIKNAKQALADFHYSGLKSIITFLDYDEAIKELQLIEKKEQANQLVNDLDALTYLKHKARRKARGKIQPTDLYINELENEISKHEDLISASVKNEIISNVAKTIKKRKSKKDVKRIFNKFFTISASKRTRNKRLNSYSLITHKHIMDHHNLDKKTYEKIKLNYEYNYKQ